jgi:hypothetical protein
MVRLLGQLLRSASLRSAARKYAASLGPRLRQDYGAGEYYEPGQIRAAAGKCRLKMEYIAIGYAAFMPEAAFKDLVPDKDYLSLRTLFKGYLGTNATSAFTTAAENSDAASGFSDSHHGWN